MAGKKATLKRVVLEIKRTTRDLETFLKKASPKDKQKLRLKIRQVKKLYALASRTCSSKRLDLWAPRA